MRQESDPPVARPSSTPDGAASPSPAVQRAYIEACQEAHRQMVDLQSAFQSAMVEAHVSFLKAMEASLADLRAVAQPPVAGTAAESDTDATVEATPSETVFAEATPRPGQEAPAPQEESAEADAEIGPPPAAPAAPAPVDLTAEKHEPPAMSESPRVVWESKTGPKIEPAEIPPSPEPPPESLRPSGPDAGDPGAAPAEGRQHEAVEPDGTTAPDAAPAVGKAPVQAPAAVESAFGRFAVHVEPAPSVGLAISGLASSSRLAVTDEGMGVARALVEQLQARGVAAEVVDEVPPDVSGAILLGGLRPVASFEDTFAINREALLAASNLARRFTTGRGLFVTVQDTGGDFGLSGREGERAGLGGLAGLAKTARLEWPAVTVKAIDLERGGRPAWKLARVLAEELFNGGPEIEVGISADGGRVTLETYPALLDLGRPEEVYSVVNRSALAQSSVIVASGGARGITAASLIALARNARPHMVLLGRTPLAEEPEALRGIDGAGDLRRALRAEGWAQGHTLTAEELDSRFEQVLAAREIRANLAALQQAGSKVRYDTVDVQDLEAVKAALSEARAEWGPITGIVHGAGGLLDRPLADKRGDDFDQVFGSKVEGLHNLLQVTSGDPLGLILLFSSATARTGRRGQADYAMANEVLNKVALVEHARRGNDCLVKALNWSRWEWGRSATDGVDDREQHRIPVDVGARMLLEEVQAGTPDQVEVILGVAPQTDTDPRSGALTMLTMDAFVSAATHPFLEGYRTAAVPMLPLTLVLEWFSRITRAHCADLEMTTCRELKVLRNVRLERFYEGGDAFTVVSHQHQRGSGRELHLELYARDGSLRFTAIADMARPGATVSTSTDTARLVRATQLEELRPWPFSSIYGYALTQGPECQVIRDVQGVSDEGIVAALAGAREMGWADSWRTDVAALDGGLQLAVLWFQYQLGGPAAVTHVSSYHSHFSGLVEGPIRAVLRGQSEGFQRVVCDVVFINENGTLVGELRGIEARAHIKPVAAPEPDVAVELESEAEDRDGPAEEPAVAEEPEVNLGTEIEPDVETEPEEEIAPEPDVEPEPEEEIEPDVEPEPDVELEPEKEEEPEPEKEEEPEPEKEEEPEPEKEEEPEPEKEEEPDVEPEPEEEIEPEPDVEPEPEEEIEPDVEPEPEKEEEPEPEEPEPDVEPEPEEEIEPEPDVEPEPEEEIEPDVEPEPEEVIEPDVEPEPEEEEEPEQAGLDPEIETEPEASEDEDDSKPAFSAALLEKASQIAAILDALFGRVHPNSYVVFSDVDSGDFVRFVGGEGKLHLDLPGTALGRHRMQKAEEYFATIGVEKESTEIYEAGKLAGGYESFGLDLGDDIERATQLALDIFSKIYQLPDEFALEIKES